MGRFGANLGTSCIPYRLAFIDEIAIKITISKQMVACDKQKTALVCFWSAKYVDKYNVPYFNCVCYTVVFCIEMSLT
jgi:hypothetical protein